MQTLPVSGFDDYVVARSASLLRFAYVLCGDRHLAEDLVQEVLIKAHRRWSAIEAENPDVYLKRALVRTHVSWRRRRASSEIVTATVHSDQTHQAHDEAHASREELWAMLATLPRAQRAVLVLRYFEDLDDRRIAEILGSAASTVRVHAHRGLHALRETLATRADEAPAGAGMADHIRLGAAKAGARRRVGGGLALLLVVLALLASMLWPASAPPPVEPSPTPTNSPSPIPSSQLVLVPTPLAAPVFPYAFTFVPPGVGAAYVESFEGQPILKFGEPTLFESWDPLEISVRDQRNAGNPGQSAVMSTVTVNGEPATQWVSSGGVDGPFVQLEWQHDGRWFFASTDGTVDANGLRRFAESLTPGRTASAVVGPIDQVGSVALPPGYVVHLWQRDQICARPEASRDFPLGVCVTVLETLPEPPYVRTFTIDGDPAYLYQGVDGISLVVQRADGRIVGIGYGGEDISFTTEELIAIYRGITFTG